MNFQNEIEARRNFGLWQGASEAHIRSDLLRASNVARGRKDQRVSLILKANWNKPKSTLAYPKSTVHLRLEPLIRVENTLITHSFLGSQHQFRPTTTREWNRKTENKTETNQKIIQGPDLDLSCLRFGLQLSAKQQIESPDLSHLGNGERDLAKPKCPQNPTERARWWPCASTERAALVSTQKLPRARPP
jgi:hypothetical protein